MKKALLLLTLGALVFAGWREYAHARDLAAQLARLQSGRDELARLQREHERLVGLQASPDELAQWRSATNEAARLRIAAAQDEASQRTRPALLHLGEWYGASEWKDRGNTTPHAAIESVLWAAAGGDVAKLKQLLVLSTAAREKAEAVLAQLPQALRERFAGPDDLVAEFTIKSIPIGEAQLVWFNQTGDDDASACLFLQKSPAEQRASPPEVAAAPAISAARVAELSAPFANLPPRERAVQTALALKAERAAHPDLNPPRAADPGNSAETFLSLHREPGGWRLVVPVDAVTQIARELGAAPRS